MPKNSTINAIYNQLNELDNQKAAAVSAEPNYERKIEEPVIAALIPSKNLEQAAFAKSMPTTHGYSGITYNNNISPTQNYSNNTPPPTRSTISPTRAVDLSAETKPKLMINHGKPNFVRPAPPTMRPKPLETGTINADRPESNDITRTLRRLKSVELLDQGNEEEPTVKPLELAPKLVSKVRPVENIGQNVIRNNVFNNNGPTNPSMAANNVPTNGSNNFTNAIYNNTNSSFAEHPTTHHGGSPFVTRKFVAPTPLQSYPEPTPIVPVPKNNGLPNFIRKLDATEITDDMQLSEDIFLTHVRLNTGDANNIVYVPQGLPFKMVLNTTPILRNTGPLAEKPQYLQKSPPITNQPSAFNFGNPIPRSPPSSSGSITPPGELNGKKSAAAASKHILDQLQTLRKVDLKGDSSWMNRNNQGASPEEPTAIVAKEATPFQSNAVPHNPTITPPATIHHLRNNNITTTPNFDIRNVTSFAKDLMDAPNRYPDTVVVTNNTRHVDENGRVINETTFSRKVVSSTSNGGGHGTITEGPNKPTNFFSNLKFVIEENGDIRPNVTQMSH